MKTKKAILLTIALPGLVALLYSVRFVPSSLAVNGLSQIACVPDEVIVKFRSNIQKASVAQIIDNIGG
jgi:hypothetical protein